MGERKQLILSLGSNCDQHEAMSAARLKLRELFGDDIVFSRLMWTKPIGIKSGKFLNCLGFTHTSHKLEYVNKAMKNIERTCGNRKRARANNIVKMDIDILKYGEQTLHEEDWTRMYVIKMMEECPF